MAGMAGYGTEQLEMHPMLVGCPNLARFAEHQGVIQATL